ncbi:MAG: SprT family zinc-dependent metalloprotease [Polyangiaceae bacterium]
MTSLTVDDLRFEVRHSARRRSVQITVDRGGELLLSAPEGCPTRVMEEIVREKRFWIYTKLAEKEALPPSPPPKQLVSGEGFPYLGRSYRLRIVDDQEAPVKLEQGRFKMSRAAVPAGRAHLVKWYSERGRVWLAGRVARLRGRVAVEPSGVSVQDLGFRWGSCGKGGRLFFHWRTVLLPPRIIEYVVVHELVHLHEPHHTPAFWRRVERAMPDFAGRKEWLAENGREAAGV